MSDQLSAIVKKAYSLLTLDHQIVGAKFAATREDYEKMEAKKLVAKLAYCVMVKAAMSCKSLKLSHDYSGCSGSTRALGFKKPTEDFISGEIYNGFGLYKDLTTSKSVADNMSFCKKSNYGIMVKPLELYKEEVPDVVIIAADSRNAMRIIQGYTYMYAAQSNFKMTGNQAICVECTSYPFESEQINISMLCSGTRYLAKWKDTEIAIGIPFHKFKNTIEGVLKTANAVELDARKTAIQQNLLRKGLPIPEFEYGHTYYTDIEKKNKKL